MHKKLSSVCIVLVIGTYYVIKIVLNEFESWILVMEQSRNAQL